MNIEHDSPSEKMHSFFLNKNIPRSAPCLLIVANEGQDRKEHPYLEISLITDIDRKTSC